MNCSSTNYNQSVSPNTSNDAVQSQPSPDCVKQVKEMLTILIIISALIFIGILYK